MVPQLPLPGVEDRGLQLVLVAQVADGDLVQVMLSEQVGFLRRGVIPSSSLAHQALQAASLARRGPGQVPVGAKHRMLY